jgi:hypothetical protein
MTTPHELLRLAHNDLDEANRLWAGGRADPNTIGEITQRIAMAQAQALLALGELVHEHLHPQPTHPPVIDETAQIEALIAEVPDEVRAEIEHRAMRRPESVEDRIAQAHQH